MLRLLWALAVLLLASCGSSPPAARVGSEAHASGLAPVAPPSGEPPRDASPRELRGALRVHREPTPPAPLVDGRVEIPDDWKQLPQSAVTWRSEDALQTDAMVAFEGSLVGRRGEEFVGLDPTSGRELWSRPSPEGSPNAGAMRGCEGTAVLVQPTGITGVDATTGEERWARTLEPRDDTSYGRAGTPAAHGCTISFRLVRGSQRLAVREPSTLLLLDTTDGSERELPGCDQEGCRTSELSDEAGALLIGAGGERRVNLADGVVTPLPQGTQTVVLTPEGPLAVVRLPRLGWRGVRLDGSVVWERRGQPRQQFRALLRVGQTLVGFEASQLVRLDLVTGDARWSLGVSDELTRGFRYHSSAVVGDTRLVLANRATPGFLLLIGLDDGRLEGVRLTPQQAVGMAMAGEHLFVGAADETVGVRLDRESAPIRDRLSLEEDLRRSIAQLTGPQVRQTGYVLHHDYPMGARAARRWLTRLGSEAQPALRRIALEGSLEDAAGVVTAMGVAPLELEQAVLRRSISQRPDVPHANLRRHAAEAFGGPSGGHVLSEQLARALADNAVAWVEHAGSEGWFDPAVRTQCRDAARCELMGATVAALTATRDLLERASARADPILRVRAAIAAAASGDEPPATPRCTPTGDDAARVAVLAHLFEFGLRESAPILAPGIGCAPLITPMGPLEVSADERTNARPYWLVSPAESPGERPVHWGVPAWDNAPMRKVSYGWFSGPLDAEGSEFYVIELDGLWRVVAAGARWVS